MQYLNDTELSSHEGTRCQFNGGTGAIKLGIDVHQDFYVVVERVGGTNPKPPQRFSRKENMGLRRMKQLAVCRCPTSSLWLSALLPSVLS